MLLTDSGGPFHLDDKQLLVFPRAQQHRPWCDTAIPDAEFDNKSDVDFCIIKFTITSGICTQTDLLFWGFGFGIIVSCRMCISCH